MSENNTKGKRRKSSQEAVEQINKHRKSVGETLEELNKLQEEVLVATTTSDPKKRKSSLDSFIRRKEKVEKAIKEIAKFAIEEAEDELYGAIRVKVSVIRHKDKVLSVVDDLNALEASLKKGPELDPKKKEETDAAIVKHKRNVQTAIGELNALSANLEVMKKQQVAETSAASGSANNSGATAQTTDKEKDPASKPEKPNRNNVQAKKKEVEEALVNRHYDEDDIALHQLSDDNAQEYVEKIYDQVENDLHAMLMWVTGLTLVTALLTAITCYIFAELPDDIYTSHILHEVFMIEDEVMKQSGFAKPIGLHSFCPLALVIGLMYTMIFFIVYLTQYPGPSACEHYIRCILYVIVEAYFIICAVSYIIDSTKVSNRLDTYFEHDQKGLKGHPESKLANHSDKFHALDNSQYYFSCCGYRDKKEWAKVFPETYYDRWPLSCCDEEISKIACYHPVRENVTYTDYGEDGDGEERETSATRLHESTCFEIEDTLTKILCGLVIFHVIVFILITIYTFVLYIKTAYLVRENHLIVDVQPKYIDTF